MFATGGASAAFGEALWLPYGLYIVHCLRCTDLRWASRDIGPSSTVTVIGTGIVGSHDGAMARANTNTSNNV